MIYVRRTPLLCRRPGSSRGELSAWPRGARISQSRRFFRCWWGNQVFAIHGPGGVVFAASGSIIPRSSLDSNVLLLNAHYTALRVVSARRAFTLLVKHDGARQPVAEVVDVEDGRYVSYDFHGWTELSAHRRANGWQRYDWVRTVRVDLAVPRIVRVLTFHKLPRREIRFNRRNVFARDEHTCQYCGRRYGATQLSLDHIVPRSQGGDDSWENVVCACIHCNVRKGGRTPAEANLHLIRRPQKPRRNPLLAVKLSDKRYASWQPFLDVANWDIQLS